MKPATYGYGYVTGGHPHLRVQVVAGTGEGDLETPRRSPVPRELHGFTKPAGFATGFSGVRVGVQNFVPQRNPYP